MYNAVSIDGGFVRVGGKSYAVNKITSVEVRRDPKNSMGGAVVLGLLAFAAVCISPSEPALLAVAAFMAYLSYDAWKKAQVRSYRLLLMLSSQEAETLVTTDEGEVFALRDRIESAMASA